MKKPGFIRRFLLFGTGFILLSAGIIAIFFWSSRSPDELRKIIEENVQEDFLDYLTEVETRSQRLVREFSVGKSVSERDGAIRMAFNPECYLLDWNESEWMPSRQIVRDFCTTRGNRTFPDNNKVYYILRNEYKGYVLVTLIPLQVTYKVDNSNLPPHLYLGRYNERTAVQKAISGIRLQEKTTPSSLNIYNQEGEFAYSFIVKEPEDFFFRSKAWAAAGFSFGLILLLIGIFYEIRRKKGLKWAAVVLSALIIVVRFGVFYFNFPSGFVPVKLFSPTLLALDNLTPSLGDLILNVISFLLLCLLLTRAFHRSISRVYRRILPRKILAWAFQVFILVFSVMLVTFFFHMLNRITLNSKLNFEFSNVFELDGYSVVAFIIIGMMLLGFQIILYQLLRFSYHFIFPEGRISWVRLGGSLLFLLIPSLLLWWQMPAYIIVVALSVALTMVILARTRGVFVFQLDILNFLFAVTLFSMLTSVGILTGDRVRRNAEMELIAERLSNEHDLITESLFYRMVTQVKDDLSYLQHDRRQISRVLRENYFAPNFKGYEVRVFVYDHENELISGSGGDPILPASSEMPLSEVGISTLTPGLYLVPFFKSVFDHIYVGEFNLLVRKYGTILVQVELRPTAISPNQLYPNLLLDDVVRAKSFVSRHFDYAIYKEGKLLRKHSTAPFPRLYQGPQDLEIQNYRHDNNSKFDRLFYKSSDQKIIQVRTRKKTLFDAANLFSFTFYFNILGFIFLMLPYWVYKFASTGVNFLQGSLKSKIQGLFLSLSVVPLFIVIFLLSPYIKRHFYEELSLNLQDETARVASLVREDYLKLFNAPPADGSQPDSLVEPFWKNVEQIEDLISSIERTIFNDVNIYSRSGRKTFTTQRAIFDLGLKSEFMNPVVLGKILEGETSDLVVEEKIGNLSYFSGYYPLMSDNNTLMGFVNIPFLKNQDEVNEQAQSLLTFLVDIYVFVFLALGFIAVVVSNSIIRPLNLLSEKLEATTLGKMNERLEWNSTDEIGQIIKSYNQMLEKLAESEEKLAKNQREMAWKEMARQVAHEIKNPLTPMKLSVQHLVRAWDSDHPNLKKMFEKVTKTILVQIDSLVNIANSFSEFAKMPEPKRSTFLLQEVVSEVGELYAHHEEVQIEMHLPEPEFYVNSDRDQLSRVFNNLVKNGIQAIEHEEGRVEIRMSVEGNNAYIDIQDNGKGIPDDIKKKIFQPNFSTKSSGMGLGLAIVKRIIEGAGGTIDFESTLGEGTIFHIVLPRAEKTD